MFLDHVVIKVDDLAQASAVFTDWGFTVVAGGEHPAFGSHNALIAFADGSYLELIAFREPQPSQNRSKAMAALKKSHTPAECRLLTWKIVAEGLLDFALIPETNLEDFAQKEHLDFQEPFPMGRKRPDGVELKWEMQYPVSFDLPFLIRDITARNLRVPQAHSHPLGVTGVARLMVAVRDLAASRLRYQALLNVPPQSLQEQEGAQGVSFVCGSARIDLLAPAEAHHPLQTHLEQREESVWAMELSHQGDPPPASILETLARMKIFLKPAQRLETST